MKPTLVPPAPGMRPVCVYKIKLSDWANIFGLDESPILCDNAVIKVNPETGRREVNHEKLTRFYTQLRMLDTLIGHERKHVWLRYEVRPNKCQVWLYGFKTRAL